MTVDRTDEVRYEIRGSAAWITLNRPEVRNALSRELLTAVGSRLTDNALAEAFNSLHKAELVRNRGPWRGLDDLEMATVEYIDWYNRCLHGELDHVPPAEHEALHAMTQPVTATLETS